VGVPFRDIARRFETSPAAAHRHSRHVGRAVAEAAAKDPVAYGRVILSQARHLGDRAVRILDRAEREGGLRAATGAIREARGCLELVARLEGTLVERHAHLHAQVEDREFKRQQAEYWKLPEEQRVALRQAAHDEILYGTTGESVEDAEVVS